MAKRSGGLGKGMNALFGEDVTYAQENNENIVQMISIGLIDPNKNQPRKMFDIDALDQLASSIRAVGIIQPIVLSANGKRYTIIAGERRWRAARLAELSEVPAIVRDMEAIQRMEVSLIENIQRTNLNPLEEAHAIGELIEECGMTQEQVAQRLGKSRSAVTNLLRLLNLPKPVAAKVASGELTEGHARALLGAENERDIINLSEQVLQRGLNVRQTEALVKFLKEDRKPAAAPKRRCAELTLVEEAARRRFGTKVTITGDEHRGKLVLHYNNAEDLERIYEYLRIREE